MKIVLYIFKESVKMNTFYNVIDCSIHELENRFITKIVAVINKLLLTYTVHHVYNIYTKWQTSS